MKIKYLSPILVLVIALTLVFSAPAMACTPSTILTVSVSATGTPGDPVVLTITETNNGDEGLINAYITIEYDGTIDTYTAGPGWFMIGDSCVWVVTYYPLATVTYTITGHGYSYGLEKDITYDDYPDEQKIITVTLEENGLEGLTPGFWKNHLGEWANTAYSPTDTFAGVFGRGPGMTLLEAVSAKGGGEKALLRHAVAALLNASHPAVDYPMTTAEIIAAVQSAYATGNFEIAKDLLEGYNQLEIELGYNSPNVHKK